MLRLLVSIPEPHVQSSGRPVGYGLPEQLSSASLSLKRTQDTHSTRPPPEASASCLAADTMAAGSAAVVVTVEATAAVFDGRAVDSWAGGRRRMLPIAGGEVPGALEELPGAGASLVLRGWLLCCVGGV